MSRRWRRSLVSVCARALKAVAKVFMAGPPFSVPSLAAKGQGREFPLAKFRMVDPRTAALPGSSWKSPFAFGYVLGPWTGSMERHSRPFDGPQPRWGWISLAPYSQGSSFLATLGFGTESLWDSPVLRFME